MQIARPLAIVPCLDEGPRIGELVAQLRGLGFDVLVIDDGSADDTAENAGRAGASVARLPFNLGYGAALQTGYKIALARGYEQVVQLDGDGQHPATEALGLLRHLERGDADVVVGSRFLGRADYAIPPLRRLGMAMFASALSLLSGPRITDPTSGLQALNRRALTLYRGEFFPTDYPDADVLLHAHRAGLRIREAPVTMRGAAGGRSMHRGLRPLYYVYKISLGLILARMSPAVQPGA